MFVSLPVVLVLLRPRPPTPTPNDDTPIFSLDRGMNIQWIRTHLSRRPIVLLHLSVTFLSIGTTLSIVVPSIDTNLCIHIVSNASTLHNIDP